MELHHSKHHQTYVNNFNAALKDFEAANKANDCSKMVSLQSALNFNGGGHINHDLFFTSLSSPNKDGGGQPDGPLLDALVKHFGSFENFQSKINTATANVQGSGWGWLGYNKTNKSLEITTKPNQ